MSQTAETSARFRAAKSAGRTPKDRDASSLRTLLTPKQEEARQLLKKGARHTLLWGGSRSGKTFLLVCTVLARAARCPGSRHVILRYRYAHVRRSVWLDTLPKAAAAMRIKVEDRVQDGYVLVHCMEDYGGGTSQIFLGGLDDRNRTEKILGQEFSSVYFNECSQIDYSAVLMALTRLAQNCGLKLRAYYDCNPPDRGHWTYRLWFDHFDPMGRRPLADPSHYACMRINPADNPKLDEAYLDILRSQPESFQRRFLHGEFSTTDDSALWPIQVIERQRCAAEDVPPMRRVVVGVDPSGASGPEDKRSDETGIVVCGRGKDGKAYVLADRSTRASPEAWAAAAVRAYHEFKADEIVAERNFGGEMVRRVIQVADPNVPVRMVTASRGKAIRAEPVAHLFATERAWLVGDFPDLEDQLRSFVPSGYNGVKSPDRADACLVPGTLVATSCGDFPIERIVAGDMVWTRAGLRTVLWAGQTSARAAVSTVHFSDGSSLTGTESHPILVADRGFRSLDAIVHGDRVMSFLEKGDPAWLTTGRPSCSWTGAAIAGIRTVLTKTISGISRWLAAAGTGPTTVISGSSITDLSQGDTTSTTSTAISSTTISAISSASLPRSMANGTLANIRSRTASGWMEFGTLRPLGAPQKKAELGIASTASIPGTIASLLMSFVPSVGSLLNDISPIARTSMATTAPRGASCVSPTAMAGTSGTRFVPSAARHSSRTPRVGQRPAPVFVELSYASGESPVYNLHVEDQHEFFANGILVHNCIHALSALMLTFSDQGYGTVFPLALPSQGGGSSSGESWESELLPRDNTLR